MSPSLRLPLQRFPPGPKVRLAFQTSIVRKGRHMPFLNAKNFR